MLVYNIHVVGNGCSDVQEAYLMGTHVSISGPEAADRLEIRELVEAYSHCADRRDAKGQMSLFTKDTHFVVFMEARSEKPSMELNRREDLAPVFDELNKYEVTTHFLGQSTVVLDGDRATGETYCIAHHVSASEGKRTLFIASLRYYDIFAKVDGKWLFAERKIIVDWTDTRPINV
jgi:SnoaL-like domain